MIKVKQDSIEVVLENGGERTIRCETGAPVQCLVEYADCEKAPFPCLGAEVNNEVVSLSYPLEVDSRIKLLTLADSAGWRIYRSSISFLLAKAAHEVFPKAELSIQHSLDTGFYCSFELDGQQEITPEQQNQIEQRMKELVRARLPIVRKKIFYQDALEYFEGRSQRDKVNLLRFRNPPKVVVYQCGDFIDLAHGPLADNTSALGIFTLSPYPPGFVLQFADRDRPGSVLPFEPQPQLFTVFQSLKKWGKLVGVRTAGDLNELIVRGEMGAFIKTEEAYQEKQVSRCADRIAEQSGRLRCVLIAGPSSSGKTTFAKRLCIQLEVNGIHTETISADNYFVEREQTPKDEQGNYDFEHIEALDLKLFHKHLRELDGGGEIELPHFDFHSGRRISKGARLRLAPDRLVIIEGIHSLNPMLTASLDESRKFKIYISALTQMNLDLNNRISTTDNRLLRRMVRDHQFRGHSALRTLEMWSSVRQGEKRWIFPYQDQAETVFSSALAYELAVLKPFAEPLLAEVKPFHPQYGDARRLQSLLQNFIACSSVGVPLNSLLREFIGNSGFGYS